MIRALIKGETAVIKTTTDYADKSVAVGAALVDQQDGLASDVTAFRKACAREAESVRGSDDALATHLVAIGASCDDQKIKNDMLKASDKLDGNKPLEALPEEKTALQKLVALEKRLSEIKAADEEDRLEEMLDILEHAKRKLKKIKDLHERALESMDMVKDQLDKGEEFDVMEEEYSELLKNTEEALLEVPTDLHIFMELNVANDLVEDVFSVFEEVERAELGDGAQGDVRELAVAKREAMLEAMEEAQDRMDDLESWLGTKPDDLKVTTEAFDQEEMPEAGIALGALSTEAEDLIGDLMKQSDSEQSDSDDGAINTAVPDMAADGEVTEGDVTSFAAKGKSGNEAPDHKEQDGRSNVGRQGMSVGETAAGSGTINEGDENIEERRTQDPTQSGQVDLAGEADTKATGGGKQGTGKADDYGMTGGVERMDSTESGSMEAMQALMANRADALYVKASMQNVRADALKDAAHHIRQSADAIANGRIEQVEEFRKRALADLRRARTELEAGASNIIDGERPFSILQDTVESGPDDAPAQYRDAVSEYYKALSREI